jgi:hypothetical protein
VQAKPIHWRPEGWQLLACGAPHTEWQPGAGYCCRTAITEVTCPACLRAFGRAMSLSGSETFPAPADAGGNGPDPSTSTAAAAATSEGAPSSGAPGTAAAECSICDSAEPHPPHTLELRLFHSDRRRNGVYIDGERVK